MISRRTVLLLVLALAVTALLAFAVHQRQALCLQVSHGFARRARITGDSARDTYLCSAMYERMPAGDWVLVFAWLIACLAVLRSIAIDVVGWRAAQRALWIELP